MQIIQEQHVILKPEACVTWSLVVAQDWTEKYQEITP